MTWLKCLRISPLWEIPAAFVSFGVFHSLRAVLLFALRGRARVMGARNSPRWSVLSSEALKKLTPLIMLVGPRWNTHALIASVVPVRLSHRIVLDGRAANSSAERWSAVLTSLDRRTEYAFESSDGDDEVALEVKPGSYSLSMRYYGVRSGAVLPELRLDNQTVIPSHAVEDAGLALYDGVRAQKKFGYQLLAWYIYPLLRWRRYFPQRFVTREYLPAGDPNTRYAFDVVERGQRLTIDVPAAVLASHWVLFTAYNRASFPTVWFPVTKVTTETQPMQQQGFWLLRLCPRPPHSSSLDVDQIVVAAS